MSAYDVKSCVLYKWKRKPRSVSGIFHDAPFNWNVYVRVDKTYKFNNENGKIIEVDYRGYRFVPNAKAKELVTFYNECDNKEEFIKFLEDNYEAVSW